MNYLGHPELSGTTLLDTMISYLRWLGSMTACQESVPRLLRPFLNGFGNPHDFWWIFDDFLPGRCHQISGMRRIHGFGVFLDHRTALNLWKSH